MKDMSHKIRYRSSNSTDVDYGFGQLGSAYSDVAQLIIPPMGMVIVAIQFLADNTPTVLTPELLGRASNTTLGKNGGLGSNFPEIVYDAASTTAIAHTHTSNINGRLIGAINDNAGSNITQVTFTSLPTTDMRVGDYVMMCDADWTIDGTPGPDFDVQTPSPIYDGPYKRGIYIKSIDSATQVTLDSSALADTNWAGLSPNSQALMIIGERQGAGGCLVGEGGASGQTFPKGMTIYGRWTEFKPSATSTTIGGGVICYFGY